MDPTKTDMESRIVASTVLQNRAVVTRKGIVKLVPGDNVIKQSNLPLNLVENSVRVNGEGPAGAKIISVELKKEYLEEVTDVKLRELEKVLEGLRQEDVRLKHDLEELNSGLGTMREMTGTISEDLARGYGFKRIELGELDKFVKYIPEQMHDLNSRIRLKNVEITNHQKKIQAAQGEYSKLSSMGGKEVNSILVDIEAAKLGDFDLTLEYVMEGASWYPLYDARVLTDEGKVDFTYFGMVQQETGENWKSTVITLSTAPDSPSTQLPELSPWYLSAYQPMRYESAKKGRKMFAQTMSMPSSAPPPAPCEAMEEKCADEMTILPPAPPPKVAAVAQTATVSTSGEAVVYKIEKPSDIDSEEESPKKLTVGMFKLPADIKYLTVPKVAQEVYTKARIVNESEFMILPGDVNLFADSEFIGVSGVGNVAPREKFDFSLGITKAIKVRRELLKREVSSAGMTGKGRRIKYAYRIKVENNKKIDASITVKDQIPISQHEKIKIEDVAYADGCDPTKKSDMGILEWSFTLPPGKKRTIEFEFAIVYPQEMSIEGATD
jgi:uncharacterized protein (TIGR02231 family)